LATDNKTSLSRYFSASYEKSGLDINSMFISTEAAELDREQMPGISEEGERR
jgi:hypothetical protein